MRTSILGLATLALGCSLAACSADSGDVGSTDEAVTMKCGASANGPVQGVDVSIYQGNFNWSGAGVEFGYARISDGNFTIDSEFANNWSKMKAAGVMRGAYQFFRPNQDAAAQANLMVKMVGGKLGVGDLPAMIDVEVTGGEPAWMIAQKIHQWLQIVEAGTGKRPFIYTGSYFWQDNVKDTSFGQYPVWIAAYGPSCPSLPAGWSNWLMWQYSDGNGKLDHDVFNGSLAQLKAYAGVPSAPPGPPTAKPAAATGCGDIKPGEGLVNGESYKSCDGRFDLAMQTDGNLVLYGLGRALWSSNTPGSDGYAAIMQSDGNFVLYGKHSDALWDTGTNGHGGSTLALQDDGNIVVYSGSQALWASGTNVIGAPAKPTGCGAITPGHGLASGESVGSCDGHYSFAMQTDGNLVYYHDGNPIWASGTAGSKGYSAEMQGDGNFVLYDYKGAPLFWTGTNGHAGAWLGVQGDGNLVVYGANNTALWASHTNGR